MGKLDGKVAVITGGNSGIGLATAQLFHEEGATVVITGRNQAKLKTAVSLIGERAVGVRSDTAVLQDIEDLFASVADQFGKIDVLFLNAGVARFAPVPVVTEEFFDQIFDINVKGLYFTVQKALPLLNPHASIILTTSVANQKGSATMSVYAASKAAVRSFARTLSAELLEQGIRVNALSPGPIETPIFDTLGLPSEAVDGIKESFTAGVPMKRLGSSQEVARAALFLASSDSSYVLGSELMVDGGMTQL